MLSNTALKKVYACIADCDELIKGRYLFAENIIAKILNDIGESEEIYDLIASCMKDFNFDRELNKAKNKLPTSNGFFIMPESRALVLPFVFCLLVDIKDGKINFSELLKTYFTTNEKGAYENFIDIVIAPFKQALIYCFGLEKLSESQHENVAEDKTNEPSLQDMQQIEVPMQDNQKIETYTQNIQRAACEIIAASETEKKIKAIVRDDINYIAQAIVLACEEKQIKYLNPLIISLYYLLIEIKPLKFLAKELKQHLIEVYS